MIWRRSSPQAVGNGRHFLGAPKAPVLPPRKHAFANPLDLVHRIFGPGPLLPPGPGPAHMPSRALRTTLVGPGPASVFRPSPEIPWTRSTLLYQHEATSNADSPQNRVAHCKSCNEQRENRPKPCYSLHAFPTLWRRFVVCMAQVCQVNGAGLKMLYKPAPRFGRICILLAPVCALKSSLLHPWYMSAPLIVQTCAIRRCFC